MMNCVRLARPLRMATMAATALVLAGTAAPLFAQDTLAETRLRRMEAEIRALQRQVFPGAADGKVFSPEIARPGTAGAAAPAAVPATTPVSDLLTRMDGVEAQMARLTAQIEENANRLQQLEARLGGAAAPAVSGAPAASSPAAPLTLPAPAAMANAPTAVAPAPAVAPKPAAAAPAASAAASTPAARPAAATPARPAAAAAAAPSPQRVAAVRAIVKPQTNDAGDDEYSYGFRLWEAKFYPEAQQQLKLMIDRYPRHARISFARNLLGRAYLEDGKPREAATWFLQNYQANKNGERASDSLLYLAESMRQLKDTNRACIALAEFAESYPVESAGRLKSQYDATRRGVTCK